MIWIYSLACILVLSSLIINSIKAAATNQSLTRHPCMQQVACQYFAEAFVRPQECQRHALALWSSDLERLALAGNQTAPKLHAKEKNSLIWI
jgi:hypothetical protein